MKNFIKKEEGITLIALVITIIVLLILAGVAISMLAGENGIINQTKVAREMQIYANAEETIKAQYEYIVEGKNVGQVDLSKTEENIRNLNLEEIKDINSSVNLLTIELDNGSEVKIKGSNGNVKLNQYGFYYNVDYVCYDYFNKGKPNDKYVVKILEDGTFEIDAYEDHQYKEGGYVKFVDFTGTKILEVNSVEINKEYTGTGVFDCNCISRVDENGDIKANMVINKDKVTYSNKTASIGGALNCVFSEDGKSFNINGKIFSIEE